ncbi:MAG: 30S ribosomal protein S16 [Bacteroidales bacterium]|nr:30S ribosomal protein S16 [Bacteroidales bacterium]
MPARIRLARRGRKGFAYYHIVIADRRAPRDGKFIEKVGMYNPNTNPATIELDFDKVLDWFIKGAQPTETVRAILSYKGILYKKHLLEGVKKGAFDQEEADKRFQTWLQAKEAKIQAKRDRISDEQKEDTGKRLKAETKVRETRAQELAKKASDLVEKIRKAGDKETGDAEAEEEPQKEAAAADIAATPETAASEEVTIQQEQVSEPEVQEKPEAAEAKGKEKKKKHAPAADAPETPPRDTEAKATEPGEDEPAASEPEKPEEQE